MDVQTWANGDREQLEQAWRTAIEAFLILEEDNRIRSDDMRFAEQMRLAGAALIIHLAEQRGKMTGWATAATGLAQVENPSRLCHVIRRVSVVAVVMGVQPPGLPPSEWRTWHELVAHLRAGREDQAARLARRLVDRWGGTPEKLLRRAKCAITNDLPIGLNI